MIYMLLLHLNHFLIIVFMFSSVRAAGLIISAALGLTGSEGRGRDLDLAGRLVRLEGRGPAAGAEVSGEQVGALGACGAGAGAVAAMMRLLLVVHSDELQGGETGS